MLPEYPQKILWPLDDLKPHPRQTALFDDLTDAELALLAADIKANGLREPPHVLPDGTLVTGHQRVRACRLLGMPHIPVVIRADWAEEGAEAVERHLIEDNLNRRQLDELAVARGYQRLKELEKKRKPGALRTWERSDLRDRLAKRFGVSGRTLDRYLLVLRAPLEVQKAFSAKTLTLLEAGRVGKLTAAKQAEIVKALHTGKTPKEVVAAYLPARPAQRRRVADAVTALARDLKRGLDDLGDRLDTAARLSVSAATHATLLRAQQAITTLLRAPVVDDSPEAIAKRLQAQAARSLSKEVDATE